MLFSSTHLQDTSDKDCRYINNEHNLHLLQIMEQLKIIFFWKIYFIKKWRNLKYFEGLKIFEGNQKYLEVIFEIFSSLDLGLATCNISKQFFLVLSMKKHRVTRILMMRWFKIRILFICFVIAQRRLFNFFASNKLVSQSGAAVYFPLANDS